MYSSVKEQICEQASSTVHHINRAKPFTENSAVAKLQDIVRGLGPAEPLNLLKHMDWAKKRWSSAQIRPIETNS